MTISNILAVLERARKHAKQGMTQPEFAKDQCWEIEQAMTDLISRIRQDADSWAAELHGKIPNPQTHSSICSKCGPVCYCEWNKAMRHSAITTR